MVADQARLTGLDHRLLICSPPVGSAVILHKTKTEHFERTHTYAHGARAFCVQFSRVTAWVNRLFEASENWISEAALLFSPVLALTTPQLTGKDAL